MNQSKQPQFEDITLYDQETGEPFIFTAGEQRYFAKHGLTNVPKYTPERRKMKELQRNKGRESIKIQCMDCKRMGKILQEPPHPKHILCETCFKKRWEAHLEKHPEIRALHQPLTETVSES